MPRRKAGSGWLPPLRPHRGPDSKIRGRVWLNGRYHYCGAYGSLEAEVEHRRLIVEWLANGQATRKPEEFATVSELLEAFSRHTEVAYHRNKSELCIYRILVGYVNSEPYGSFLIDEFRPRHLKAIRQLFLAHRWSRKTGATGKPWSRRQVNDHVRRVIRIFRWGVENDFVHPDVLHRLEPLTPLRRGETAAPDHPDAIPVDWATVKRTLPYLTTNAAALVQVLWLTGARSGEICRLCADDLDRSGPEWLFSPAKHKTARHEKRKDIWFGRRAQAILQPFIDACMDSCQPIFSTRNEPKPHRWLPHYTPDSLADVIKRAARKAGVPHWSPKQLRSGRATEVESHFSLDHAAAVLGDRLDTTRHHYSKAKALARTVAREIG